MKLKQFLMELKRLNQIIQPLCLGVTPAFLPVVIMLTFVLFALVGCSSTPVSDDDFKPTPVTFNIKVPYKCGQPPSVGVVILRDINWEVIDVEGLVFDEGDEPFTGQLITLTVDDYKALGMNISDWIAASGEMKDQRTFYRDCIIRSQKEINKENENLNLENQ